MELCHILHPRKNDVNDISGCLKTTSHNDSHICITKNGEYVEWEDDYECMCGCWNDLDDSPCGVYSVISKEEALDKINKSFNPKKES